MRVYTCTLIFTFVIFFNSVQSSSPGPFQPPDNLVFRDGRPFGILINGVLYELQIPAVRTRPISPPRPQPPPEPISPPENALVYRRADPIGRIQGKLICELHPTGPDGQLKLMKPEDGDLVMDGGRIIAKYEKKIEMWRMYRQ